MNIQKRLYFIVILFAFMSFAISLPGQAVSAPAGSAEVSLQKTTAEALLKPRNDIPGLKNFAKVSDELYRGQQPDAEGFRQLKKMGIKTVVNLRAFHSDRSMLTGLKLRYYNISFKTWHAEDEDVVDFLKIMTNKKYHPVFVHCQHGADRTGTMVAVYRVVVQGWDMERAIEEMPNFGFHTIWTNLKKYLRNLDAKKIMEKVKKAAEPDVEIVY